MNVRPGWSLSLCLAAQGKSSQPSRNFRPKIITGHTGWTDDLDFAFAQLDNVCNAWFRQKPHDPSAPYDAYDESDDTEEKARNNQRQKQSGR